MMIDLIKVTFSFIKCNFIGKHVSQTVTSVFSYSVTNPESMIADNVTLVVEKKKQK